ncbi:tRNA (guanosine(46)-N7)-methyltransferase TrmB [soil metagenome]
MIPPAKTPRSVYAAKLGEFPQLAFTEHQAFARRGRWREYFVDRIGPAFDGRIILEIGCSDAAFLAQIAAKLPHTALIGLDWKFKAIYDAASGVTTDGLQNVALIRGRGQDIAKLFAASEVDEIWLFHPDPCDREVELKNRLICEAFLVDVHQTLRNGTSSLCLKTDHADYYATALEVLSRPTVGERFDITQSSSNFWADEAAMNHASSRGFAGEMTSYESRFRRKNQPIFYIEIRKRSPDAAPE